MDKKGDLRGGDNMLSAYAALFAFTLLAVMFVAIAFPFLYGLYMMYVPGSIKEKVFIIVLYAILISLFIKFEMYRMISFLR